MSANQWWQFLGWLAAETCAVLAVAALLQICFRSPRDGRTIWRAALVTIGLVWMVELSGAREWVPQSDTKNHHFIVTTRIVSSTEFPEIKTTTNASDAAALPLEVIPQLNNWPAWIWLFGVALFLARLAAAQIWLAVLRRRAATADTESRTLVAGRQADFALRQVECQAWPRLPGPVAFGILRPTIALPPDFHTRFSSAEREAMIAHELAHLAARDPLWRAIGDAVLALAWWHPLVWWARRQLQSLSEAAADEASVLVPGGAQVLAECLVRLGRELTAAGSARALGVGGSGPRAWQPMSIWGRWIPRVSAVAAAMATVFAPIQTGLSGSILSVLAMAAPARAETVPATLSAGDTNNVSNAVSNTTATPVGNIAVTTNGAIHQAQNVQFANGENSHLSMPTTNPGAPKNLTPLAVTWTATENPSNVYTYTYTVINPDDQLLARTTNPGAARVILKSISVPSSESPILTLTNVEISRGVYKHFYTVDFPSNQAGSAATRSNAPSPTPVQKGTPPALSVKVEFMEISEAEANDLGLDWFFGAKTSNGPAMETYTNWVFGLAPVTNLGGSNRLQLPPGVVSTGTNHPRNLRIDRYRAAGQSVAMNVAQHRAFRERVDKKTGIDILAAPKFILQSGQDEEIQLQDVLPIVTGVETSPGSAKKSATCNYLTDNVGVGTTLALTATMKDRTHWRLTTQAAISRFLGNDKFGDETEYIPNLNGKSLGYYAPHPHFRAVEADSDDSVLLGDTLVLRSPPWMETNKIKGHFLSHGKMTTAEHRLYVFVTPNIATEKDMKN